MNQYKVLITFPLFILVIPKVNAQQHYNSWFKTTVSYPFSQKIKADIEFHHRSQNDFENKNPFDKNLLNAIRTMVHYKHNEHLQFSISPFAYFSNNKIILTPIDAKAIPTNEYRFSAYVEIQKPIAKKLNLQNRTGIEYRIFPSATTNVTRVRNRLALRYEATTKFSFLLGDELFVNARGISASHIFDHNRIIGLVSFKPLASIKFELGYIHSNRIPKASTDLISEENILFNVGFTIPHK
jgi:Protein of unknown function (DUF2490)